MKLVVLFTNSNFDNVMTNIFYSANRYMFQYISVAFIRGATDTFILNNLFACMALHLLRSWENFGNAFGVQFLRN